jgi:hypothetical protein
MEKIANLALLSLWLHSFAFRNIAHVNLGLQTCDTCFLCHYGYFSSFLIISLVFLEGKNYFTLVFFCLYVVETNRSICCMYAHMPLAAGPDWLVGCLSRPPDLVGCTHTRLPVQAAGADLSIPPWPLA